jgi:hypothetical protein
MLTGPIPEAAMPVVMRLRGPEMAGLLDEYPAHAWFRIGTSPEEPKLRTTGDLDDVGGFERLSCLACPLGLLPEARVFVPLEPEEVASPAPEEGAFRAFTRWWDEQSDAAAALEAVFGSPQVESPQEVSPK